MINNLVDKELSIRTISDHDGLEEKFSSEERRGLTPLPSGFVPGPLDVICQRGRQANTHSGNQNFRKKVQDLSEAYEKAENKVEKSDIVSSIVGHFNRYVKQLEDGLWYEINDDHIAREKVGQALRDQLSKKYTSSSRAKRRRWRIEKTKQAYSYADYDEMEKVVLKDSGKVMQQIAMMDEGRKKLGGDYTSDDLGLLTLFTSFNSKILETIKVEIGLQENDQSHSS